MIRYCAAEAFPTVNFPVTAPKLIMQLGVGLREKIVPIPETEHRVSSNENPDPDTVTIVPNEPELGFKKTDGPVEVVEAKIEAVEVELGELV